MELSAIIAGLLVLPSRISLQIRKYANLTLNNTLIHASQISAVIPCLEMAMDSGIDPLAPQVENCKIISGSIFASFSFLLFHFICRPAV